MLHRSPRRRLVVVSDDPLLTAPVGYFVRLARLVWRDGNFLEIRDRVAHAFAENGTAFGTARRSWSADDDFRMLATKVLRDPAETVRDLYLRSELLARYYGRGQINQLTGSDCPAQRTLGSLVQACWKVGGAANV
jgi:hypothetical protein